MSSFVIYARKSTESEDRQVASIESQIIELRRLAEHHQVNPQGILTESHSAKAPGRPVFSSLMKRVQQGKVSGILTWKMDRLARNHYDTGLVLQALADGHLEKVITIDRVYTRDGNDRFIGNFELGMATKYIDDLRLNVKRGNRARFERGWINHLPPLGYLWEPVTKTVVKDPDRFDLIRRMWDLMLSGTSRPSQILKIANEQWGLRTRQFKRRGGGSLQGSHIYSMFANSFYAGIIRLRSGETYRGAHPPMVSQMEFEQVQRILGQRGRPRPQKHEFAFSGLFTCATCGCRITAEEHIKPSGKRYVYYRCTHRSSTMPCREPAISEPELERQIKSLLVRLSIPSSILSQILSLVRKMFEQERKLKVTVVEAVKGKLKSIVGEFDRLLDLRLRDQVSDEQYAEKRRQMELRRIQLEQNLKEADQVVGRIPSLVESSFVLAEKAVRSFETGDPVQKRGILLAVGLNWQLKGRKVLTELKKPFQMLSEAAAISNWWASIEDLRTYFLESDEYFEIPSWLISEDPQAEYQNDEKGQGGRGDHVSHWPDSIPTVR